MPALALVAVLLAAATHATWNFAAKRAAAARHFVWLYSLGSVVLYAPVVVFVVAVQPISFGPLHWVALAATGVLHLCYSLALQRGYRVSDLSLVYPLARGSGPLLSFIGAVLLLDETATWLSALGLAFIVTGILLVAGLTQRDHKAPKAGVAFGILSGAFIAGYTINDGWAVKQLLISPVIVDYTSNAFRTIVLAPFALRDRTRARNEARTYLGPVVVVSLLGPLGYILVLFAMQIAPVSHVAPARELATLLGAYLGSRLLKEQSAPQRLLGAACIVAGVVGLALASPD